MPSLTMKLVLIGFLLFCIHLASAAEQKAEEPKKEEAHKGAEEAKKGAEGKSETPTKEDKERVQKTSKAIWKYFNDQGAMTKKAMLISPTIKEKFGAKEFELKDVRLKLVSDKKATFGVKGDTVILNQPKKAFFSAKVSGKLVTFKTQDFQIQFKCGLPKQEKGGNIDIVLITTAVDVASIVKADAFGKGITSKDAEPMLIKLNTDFVEKLKAAVVAIPDKDRC